MDAEQQKQANLANLKKKGTTLHSPATKTDWNPVRAVEKAVDQVKQKYHEREHKIEDLANEQYTKRVREIGREERSGKISSELKEKWTNRAKKKYEKERVPIEQRIEQKIEGGAKETWRRATTSPKKKDMLATKLGKKTKNVLSYANVPTGLNTLSTPIHEYSEHRNPVGRPRQGGDFGVMEGIGIHGFGGSGISGFETYDDPQSGAGMFSGYQGPFSGEEQPRGRGRPRKDSGGNHPMFASISGLGDFQSPFAGMGNSQPRGRGRPRKDSGGTGLGLMSTGISGFDSYQSPFAGLDTGLSGAGKTKRGRGRPKKSDNRYSNSGSIFSLKI